MKHSINQLLSAFTSLLQGKFAESGAALHSKQIKIHDNIHFSIPNTWEIIHHAYISSAGTTQDQDVVQDEHKHEWVMLFSANYPPAPKLAQAHVSIRYCENYAYDSSQVATMRAVEFVAYDAAWRAQLTDALAAQNEKMLSWSGVRKVAVGKHLAFSVQYTRQIPGYPTSRVEMMEVLYGKDAFMVTLTYDEAEARVLKPVLESIKHSLTIKA